MVHRPEAIFLLSFHPHFTEVSCKIVRKMKIVVAWDKRLCESESVMQNKTSEPATAKAAITNTKADLRAIRMGAEDKQVNNVDPEFRGRVTINSVCFDVISSSVFSGILHFGILGPLDGENVCGWVPACLCEVI